MTCHWDSHCLSNKPIDFHKANVDSEEQKIKGDFLSKFEYLVLYESFVKA